MVLREMLESGVAISLEGGIGKSVEACELPESCLKYQIGIIASLTKKVHQGGKPALVGILLSHLLV